ncbi:MAG: tRNA (5-methylaminomethyl-2-thiouridine)(34)-methyltransferase MnmD [Chitinophagaceae bacterium]|nr:tRNA (5-methylaminomethyl-2-thiouridine)(34)-methyltransferase MnmD [Chitinophagaceae bacterium]MEA3425496.1 tRNA (5-methylaminomethyl-2-thiouridine)(34)-methyltransferase MnmD [Bacteroidota bacterium]MCA6451983.1 tRNA (5-methylaminomethyl-2-thiouridine)(34)-methyltransferase MnmD [Chitinophagaceae bacterium]MCA6457348.1 tRNA (5-methylaminomethyl-2-thiouridine)(34)-methyltransferase MnmD [Chitinophagaceae bacterium]MCA6458661.1 tRNA (5-methylaminomethyl-2-thiouridine)(34)-methyltransferase M
MQREIRPTADGSHTIAIPGMDVTYHSHHGAIGESRHVFLEAGLHPLLAAKSHQPLHVLEMGMGTGLNALLTLQEARVQQYPIRYTAVELYPLTADEISQINYGTLLQCQDDFMSLHRADWETEVRLHSFFTIHKRKTSLLTLEINDRFNCIYFDAFSPTHQPELWTEAVFAKLYQFLSPGGILVTYCSKSVVRKAMMAAGLTVEKIPGPWGKREMVRATRQ